MVHRYTEIKKVSAFIKWPYQRTIQSAESGQQASIFRRSAPQELGARYGVVPVRRRVTHQSKRGEYFGPHVTRTTKLQLNSSEIRLSNHYAALISAPRPLSHNMHMGAVGVTEMIKRNSMVWRLSWDRLVVPYV